MELVLYNTFFNTFFCSSFLCFVIDLFLPHYRVNHHSLTKKIVLLDYMKMIPLVSFNLIISIPFFYLTEALLVEQKSNVFNGYMNFVIWLYCTVILFYGIHRCFHTKYLKKYHAIHHEFRYTYGMGAFYAHPIEMYFGNLVPAGIPMVIFCMPLECCQNLIVVAVVYSVIVSHGSYNIDGASSHLYHHLKYKYNFGFGGIDELMGTSYSVELQNRRKMIIA